MGQSHEPVQIPGMRESIQEGMATDVSSASRPRLLYQVLADARIVKVLRLWSHYNST